MAITDIENIPNAYHAHYHQRKYSNGYTPQHQHYHCSSYPTYNHVENGYSQSQHEQYLAQNVLLDVWSENFEEGMKKLRELTKKYKFVAVDTEFPGVVARLEGQYESAADQAYHNIKVNIDLLKPIQIGFSFLDENGSHAESVSTVQFNFKWDLRCETHATDSIKLLENSGIDFERLKQHGIEVETFAEAFTNSGLALNDSITWIGFHSAYDWAYLLKICTMWNLMPEKYDDYERLLTMYFPRIVDIKTMVHDEKSLPKCGLQELGDKLNVKRVGAQHQAGSDARLTGEAYFRFLEVYKSGKLDMKFLNAVYGLNFCPFAHVWTPSKTTSPPSSNSSGRTSPTDSVPSLSPPESITGDC